MPSVAIEITATTIEINGQPYQIGSIRPRYNGDLIELIFPWWNNQSLINATSWQDMTGNGLSFDTLADFKTFFDEAMLIPGSSSVPAAQFTIGDGAPGTPLDGASTYMNPRITTASKISKNGMGYLTLGVDYTFVTGGGITLIGGDPAFHTGQVWVVFF